MSRSSKFYTKKEINYIKSQVTGMSYENIPSSLKQFWVEHMHKQSKNN